MISTKNIKHLPTKETIKRIGKAVAVLDAILSPEHEYRYYAFNSKWSEDEAFFELNNGCGDQLLILFQKGGCVLNGFAHELFDFEAALPAKSKLTNGLPEKYHEFIFGEPVNSIGTTFCIWNNEADQWEIGDLDYYEDGSDDLLEIFDGNPQTYIDWVADYFEKEIPLDTVKEIYAGQILTKKMVLSLVDEIEDWPLLEEDLKEIDFQYDFN